MGRGHATSPAPQLAALSKVRAAFERGKRFCPLRFSSFLFQTTEKKKKKKDKTRSVAAVCLCVRRGFPISTSATSSTLQHARKGSRHECVSRFGTRKDITPPPLPRQQTRNPHASLHHCIYILHFFFNFFLCSYINKCPIMSSFFSRPKGIIY